jgi:iron complex transport system substrate-binding protein
VEALAARLKGVRPVRVLSAGLYPFTAGAGTTFQDLCDHAGALNVAAEAGLKGHAPTPSEKLLVWQVEVLIAAGDDTIRARLGELPCYRVLPAFKAGRIVAIPGPLMSSVSHHRIATYEALARALHPERFR